MNTPDIEVCEICHGFGNNGADDAQCLNCGGSGKCDDTPDTEWQRKFLNAGTEKGLGDLSMMIGVVSEILTSRDTYWKERVEHILDSHIEMAKHSLKNAVADQVAPYKHQLGRLLQAKSEILNILSDNLN